MTSTLYIDLASHSEKLFALCSEKKVLASAKVDDHTDESALLQTLEKMLKKAKMTWVDVDRLAVATGPGGFMSLRVGVALGNTLSHVLNIPSAGVHLSDLWLARSSEPKAQSSKRLWLHSTRKTHLFIRGGKWKKPVLLSVEDILKKAPKDSLLMGELIAEHQEALKKWKRATKLKKMVDVLPSLLRDQTYKKQLLKPWYGREG